MHKKVFIDCGFYAGSSTESFKLTPEYSPDFLYYGFDPMMNIDKARETWTNIALDNKAVWVNDGEIDFYTSRRHGGRANGIYHNKRAGRENNLKVKCIDFSKWLSDNFGTGDFIIVKMDIEGAEYEVIPKMIKDSTIDFVDIIYLEWHSSRVADTKYKRTIEISSELKKIDGLIVRRSIERYLRSLKVNRKEQIK